MNSSKCLQFKPFFDKAANEVCYAGLPTLQLHFSSSFPALLGCWNGHTVWYYIPAVCMQSVLSGRPSFPAFSPSFHLPSKESNWSRSQSPSEQTTPKQQINPAILLKALPSFPGQAWRSLHLFSCVPSVTTHVVSFLQTESLSGCVLSWFNLRLYYTTTTL